jgi:hypothetical protein
MNLEKNTTQGSAKEYVPHVVPANFVYDDRPEFFRASDSTCHHPDGSLMDPPPDIFGRIKGEFPGGPHNFLFRWILQAREKFIDLAAFLFR